MGGDQISEYAQLPDELIEAIIHDVPATVHRSQQFTRIDFDELAKGKELLCSIDLIGRVEEGEYTDSLVAVDGGYAIERLADIDLTLVQAAGVEGLRTTSSETWGQKHQQYLAWQYPLSHNLANETLVRGIMSLMEMVSLAGSEHEIKLLDGSHISHVIAMNKLFAANQESADASFIAALDDFLAAHFEGDIYRVSQVLSNTISNDSIIASTKYSSSRAAIDTYLSHLPFFINDKALFGRILEAGEYLVPRPIHRANQEGTSWDRAQIAYDIPKQSVDRDKFNWLMNEAIGPIRTRDIHNNEKQSNLFYMYFKPSGDSPAYRLEVKQSLALDTPRLHRALRSIKQQIVYPDIIEPYPQYLADIIAKSVSQGMRAVKEAVVLAADKNNDASESMLILRSYRT